MQDALDFSVVVPTYNRRESVGRLLETLSVQDFPSSRFEIIVVIDGSTDGTAEALRMVQTPCRFRVISQENCGQARARNVGFQAAEGTHVLFLDDDMQCHPGLISAHGRAHLRFGPGVMFGALFLSSQSVHNLATECFKREIGAFHLRHQGDPTAEWDLTECVFSNASIPRRILADAGGFDEQFRVREDLELGIRLAESGVRMEYVSDAIAFQHYDKSAADLLDDAERFAVADVKLADKHPGYIIEGHLKWLERQRGWKKTLRTLVARSPLLESCLLTPWCALGNRFFALSLFRSAGVRALQMRRRIHWQRAVQRIRAS